MITLKRDDYSASKWNRIKQKLIDYYNVVDNGKLALPAFIKAEMLMAQVIRNSADLNYWYYRAEEF